jgi:predicted DNA-binding protein
MPVHKSAPTEAQTPADVAAKRRTFRLPGRLANRMKAYAATTGQYQYVVATEALRQFLDEAVPALDFARRARMAEIQSHLEAPPIVPPPGAADQAAPDHAPRPVESC